MCCVYQSLSLHQCARSYHSSPSLVPSPSPVTCHVLPSYDSYHPFVPLFIDVSVNINGQFDNIIQFGTCQVLQFPSIIQHSGVSINESLITNTRRSSSDNTETLIEEYHSLNGIVIFNTHHQPHQQPTIITINYDMM